MAFIWINERAELTCSSDPFATDGVGVWVDLVVSTSIFGQVLEGKK